MTRLVLITHNFTAQSIKAYMFSRNKYLWQFVCKGKKVVLFSISPQVNVSIVTSVHRHFIFIHDCPHVKVRGSPQ